MSAELHDQALAAPGGRSRQLGYRTGHVCRDDNPEGVHSQPVPAPDGNTLPVVLVPGQQL